MIDHVVRRGLSHPSTINFIKRAAQDPESEVSAWGSFILGLSVVVLVAFVALVSLTTTPLPAYVNILTSPDRLCPQRRRGNPCHG
jgi:hypothetical protein